MSRIVAALLAAVAAVVLVGALFRLYDDRSAPPIVIENPPETAEIVVVVEGAVATPGLVRLPSSARWQDAVDAAGGLTADADLAAVNLARRLHDEDRILIPTRGEPTAAPGNTAVRRPSGTQAPRTAAQGDETATSESATGAGGKIDLNSADAAQLDELPGIGPVLAQRMLDERAKRGRFEAVEDLAAIPGISRKMVDAIRPLVTLGP